jgi:hypothetical protein
MMRARIAILALAGGVVAGSAAVAAPPQVALVENVTGNPAGVEFMDYLESGKIIELGPRDTIILSYMSSCVRETITGGTVTVGTDQSDVQAGKVARTTVPCEAGKMLLAADQAAEFGGRIFRSAPQAKVAAADSSPAFTLYGSSPMVELKAPGRLMVERIDQVSERYVVEIENADLLQGKFYDFAKRGRHLSAGGIYRVSLGGQEIVFKIDPHAKSGNTPVLGRLLRFGSAS